ncbi:arsenate reductase family protein [Bittarella massiliensis (ex Durand et al. 2017)]|uniref:arsenate reductase family protein n=1 Tax=Bittarella massiliensis (ex Durand et al. 2017) TaxID=1720313 RepID=UPI001AA125A6|nr:arsenate reductase family protein [Bittarella massiliensis (ex Durand et al. 2017)]MBO1678679.1 arsenate reductase family protein [Bittarella massiliensis (ex Durand et al. 2017)]
MNALLIWYPKCSTCQKAKAWLDEHGVACETRHIVEETPTAAELAQWHARSGLPLKRFFNTSGLVYKKEQIKDRLPGMSEEEQYALLATNGMLIKRPILLLGERVLVGFRPAEWEAAL